MCPVCIATAAWIAGGATSAGGLTAFAIRAVTVPRPRRGKRGAHATPPQPHSQEDRS